MSQQLAEINIQRLMGTIQESAEIGKLPNGGICRLTLTDEDKVMRDLFYQWLLDAGLEIRIDDFGNMYGRREGERDELAPVLIGSHLDTQPNGGKFDGILGVLGALEVIRTLNDLELKTMRPIEIVNFTNEEGARFEPAMLGSGAMTNVFPKQAVLNKTDQQGKVFGSELRRIGYEGTEENRAKDIFSFLELHIEQGPILEDSHKAIGIVSGIQGMNWIEVTVKGETAHTGTRPMVNRKDAILHAAKLITRIYSLAAEYPDLLISVGRINAYPNVINSVSSEAKFSIDIRHPNNKTRKRFTNQLRETLSMMTLVENMEIQITDIADVETEHFTDIIIEVIQTAVEKYGYSYLNMQSGAAHDAKYLNKVAPTGMIFIPSINGVSHCEEELSEAVDIERGVQVLLHSVITLANKENLI